MANYPGLSLGAVGSATFSGALTPNPAANTYNLGGGGGTLTVNASLGGSSGAVFAPGYLVLGAVSFTGSSTIDSVRHRRVERPERNASGQHSTRHRRHGHGRAAACAANQLGPNCVIATNGSSGNAAYLKLMGYSQTVGGISATNGAAIIENTETESNAAAATLTVNGAGHVYLQRLPAQYEHGLQRLLRSIS